MYTFAFSYTPTLLHSDLKEVIDDLAKHPKKVLKDETTLHSCSLCDYTSKVMFLKQHMTVHSGEKPYASLKCNYSCTQAGSLKTHLLTHSGEKPFICTRCNYSCTSASHLKRHMLHILEKGLSVANNAITPAQQLVISKYT